MTIRNRLAVALALTMWVVLLAATSSPSVAAHASSPAGAGAAPLPGTFTGMNGLLYDSAPLAVPGRGGILFYGDEFDIACGLGAKLRRPVEQLARLADLIERSGRRVVFTVAPNKSSVLSRAIDPAELPHGDCDRFGVADQDRVLDRYRDPSYLPVRSTLVKAGAAREVFWKTDPHWTTVGASVFAKALATRLDPRLGARQRYRYGSETRVGSLNELRGIDIPETVPTATPRTRVQVRGTSGEPDWSYPTIVFDYRWDSRPRARTYPGRTLLIGDSFMWYALNNLRPIFSKGRFMWYAHVPEASLMSAIKKADTVVIDVYQAFLPGAPIIAPAFRARLRRELR